MRSRIRLLIAGLAVAVVAAVIAVVVIVTGDEAAMLAFRAIAQQPYFNPAGTRL